MNYAGDKGQGQGQVDYDAMTDNQIERDYRTWSKGYLKRQKLLAMIRGNSVPSRKKVFSEIHIDEDLKIFDVSIAGRTIKCAKIYNPAMLNVKKHRLNSRDDGELVEDYWNLLTNIQRLEIEDHEGIMQTFPKPLANSLPLLESLSLSWTRVRTIPEKFFQLSHLKTLYLERNQIKSLNGIEQAVGLTRLNASHNCIDSLPRSIGQHLFNLVDVNLSGNQLRELPESVGSLVRLKTLDVSSNKLRTLPISIGHVIELVSLDVSNNQLTELPPAIVHLPNLEDFRARGNRLTNLPTGVSHLTRLAALLLRANRFTEIPAEFADLPNLQNLNMSDNQIERLSRPIVSLKYLVLDNNRLTSIDDVITGCVNLQLLSVQNNRLRVVSESIDRLNGLRSLQVSGNDELLSLPSSLSRLENLSNLGLRATHLSTIPCDVAMMPSLTSLDLDDCSELDMYLLLAYKEDGLAGVRKYLSTNSRSLTGVDHRKTIDASDYEDVDVTEMKSKEIVGLNASRMTMAPIDENNYESIGQVHSKAPGMSKPLDMSRTARTTLLSEEFGRVTGSSPSAVGYREQKALSIVQGQTTPIEHNTNVGGSNVAVKTKPLTATKPFINMSTRQTLHPPTELVSEPEARGDMELIPVSAPVGNHPGLANAEGDVVHVYSDFGDLLTSSIDVPSTPTGTFSGKSDDTNKMNDTEESDFAELYTVVSRKTKKPPESTKPPTSEKPAVRFNLGQN